MRQQLDWIDANPGQQSNPLTAALGIFENAVSADPQAELLNQLIGRIHNLEAQLGAAQAPAIIGQGELATKNVNDLKPLWRADQKAHSLVWSDADCDGQTALYGDFLLRISPESKGRWSSSAIEQETGFSVPWPVWQPSADDAKTAIVRAVDAALAERGS